MSNQKSQNDSFLELLHTNPEQGLAFLYRENRALFLSFCQRFNCPRELYIEAYHDAVLAFYDIYKSGKYDKNTASIKTLIYGIGKKKLLDKIRKEKKYKEAAIELEKEVNLLPFFTNNRLDGAGNESLGLAMQQLSDSCRRIILLFYYHRFAIESIRKEMGHANDNVTKSHKSRCLKKLAAIYKTIKR